jgi:hypothetical protein
MHNISQNHRPAKKPKPPAGKPDDQKVLAAEIERMLKALEKQNRLLAVKLQRDKRVKRGDK